MQLSLFGSTAAISAIMTLTSAPASAQATQTYDIAAQDVASALRIFSAISGREVVAASEIVADKQSRAVRGVYSSASALNLLLDGTGLIVIEVDGALVVRPVPAARANQSSADRPADAADILVTGTRIRGSAPTGSPITIIDRDAIDRSGRSTMAALVETLPQNYGGGASEGNVGPTVRGGAGFNQGFGSGINLRGLGTASTLVLFDGARPALGGSSGQFADISLVPSAAIERVELLTDGASAIYGTDAVAGVVNFRFRNRFEGFETRLRGATADGDFSDVQIGQLAGTRWSTGGVMFAVEYADRGRLSNTNRAFITEDLRPFGGPDYRSRFASPGTITAANGQIFGIPTGQDGTRLTAAQLISGQQNRSDYQKNYDVLPHQQSLSAYLAADQELAPGVSAFVRAVFAARRFDLRTRGYGQAPVAVPVSNAFYVDPIGTRQALRVQYDFSRDFGIEAQRGSVEGLSVTGGLRGRLGLWNLEASGSYGRVLEKNIRDNVINTARLATALADGNRATAFNIFGSGGGTNPATLAAIRGSYDNRNLYTSWSASVRADGPLFDLPAGNVKLAVGAEYREESLTLTTVMDRAAAIVTRSIQGLPGSRRVTAAYGEVSVPLLSNSALSWFPGTLDLSVAGRIEGYSDVGQTTNPKVGLSWQPVPGLTARASYGTSFRAPLFIENVGTSRNLYQPVALPDPSSPTGTTPVLALIGYPEKVGPESATTFTAGFDIRPPAVPGLTASASYFRIDYKDRIVTTSDFLFNFLVQRDIYGGLITDNPSPALLARYYSDPLFQNPDGIPASAIRAIVSGYTQNLARVAISGIDFDIGYARELGGGSGSLGLSGTRLFAIDQRITPTSPSTNIVGTFGGPVKLRLRGRAAWQSRSGFDLAAFVNYTDSYANQFATPVQTIASWTTFDLQLGFSVPAPRHAKSVRFSLSATNIFDRDPPYVQYQTLNSALAYDPEQASPVGRVIALQVVIGW